jgi:hypothetical protein
MARLTEEDVSTEVLVGQRKVLASGVAITESDLTIKVADLTLIVEFKGAIGAPGVKATQEGQTTIRLTLSNFYNTGLDEVFGEVNGQPLIIALWASVQTDLNQPGQAGRMVRIVSYTISSGPGWHG